MTTLLRSICIVLFIITVVSCSTPVVGQNQARLQIISIEGRFLDSTGKPVEEYDYLDPGRKYRLFPESEVLLSTLDGKKTYRAIGPGILLLDAKGFVSLNGKSLMPKPQESLFHGVTASKIPSQKLAGLPIRGLQVELDQEKRSSIHEVDGYAHLGEDMTLTQARKKAFASAKKQALEMARTLIESNTLVKNGSLKYDLIQTAAQGGISILEQKDYGLEGNRYHVWIRAEVAYGLKPLGKQPGSSQVLSPEAPLTVKVWTPQKKYREGEEVTIFVFGNHDFYARIVNIDSEGNIIQLLPNDYRNFSLFRGGKLYKIPDAEDSFKIKVSPPFGYDQVVVFASNLPLGEVETESVGQGLRRFNGTRTRLGLDTRSIVAVPRQSGSPSGSEFYEATWELKTTSR